MLSVRTQTTVPGFPRFQEDQLIPSLSLVKSPALASTGNSRCRSKTGLESHSTSPGARATIRCRARDSSSSELRWRSPSHSFTCTPLASATEGDGASYRNLPSQNPLPSIQSHWTPFTLPSKPRLSPLRAATPSNPETSPAASPEFTWQDTERPDAISDDDLYDDWDDHTFAKQAPPQRNDSSLAVTELHLNKWRLKPVEEKYRILVERGISEKRKQELGVNYWSAWSSPGPCAYLWEWRADEQVFVVKGTLKVTPHGCEGSAEFKAGDLVRFPKWLLAELEIGGEYEQRYRFRAYGDDN